MSLKGKPLRGMIVWLEPSFIERVLPIYADPVKDEDKDKRPYIVVQCDLLNETSSRTLIVSLTTVSPNKKSTMAAPIPAINTPSGKESWAVCSEILCVDCKDIREDFDRILPLSVMKKVDRGLRRVLELDADNQYDPPED